MLQWLVKGRCVTVWWGGGRVRVLTKLAIRLEVFAYLILLHILGSVQEQAPLYVQGLHPTLCCVHVVSLASPTLYLASCGWKVKGRRRQTDGLI